MSPSVDRYLILFLIPLLLETLLKTVLKSVFRFRTQNHESTYFLHFTTVSILCLASSGMHFMLQKLLEEVFSFCG